MMVNMNDGERVVVVIGDILDRVAITVPHRGRGWWKVTLLSMGMSCLTLRHRPPTS